MTIYGGSICGVLASEPFFSSLLFRPAVFTASFTVIAMKTWAPGGASLRRNGVLEQKCNRRNSFSIG